MNAGLEFPRTQSPRCVDGQVAEAYCIPQYNAVDDAVVDIRLAHIRQRQAGDFDIIAARLFDCFSGSGHGGRGYRHDQLHTGMNLQHRLGFSKGAVTVAVARLNRHELQVRVLFCEPRFDVFDPFVLIGGAQGSRDDGKLAFVAEYAGGLVRERVANALRGRLIDEEIARVLFCISVPGQHAYAALASFAQHRRNRHLIFNADGDHIDAAGDPCLDHVVLLGGIKIGWAIP